MPEPEEETQTVYYLDYDEDDEPQISPFLKAAVVVVVVFFFLSLILT